MSDDVVTSDPVLQDISFDPNSLPQPTDISTSDPSSAWTGLDDLGSGVSNVATNVLTSFGNLVSAQVNKTALLTATGAIGRSNTAAPTPNPNAWQTFLLVGLVIGAGALILHLVRKRG